MDDEKEFIIDVVTRHILDGTICKLPEIICNPDVEGLAQQIDFGWPDFLDPYVKNFGESIKTLNPKETSPGELSGLVKTYDDLIKVCISLGLPSSFGYLRGVVCDSLRELKNQCLIELSGVVPNGYDYEWYREGPGRKIDDLLPF